MKRSLIIMISISALLFSCGDQKIDTTQARKEMEAREIKVVSDAQIIEKAMDLGNSVSEKFSIEKSDTGYSVSFGNDSLYQKAYYLFDQEHNLTGKELQLFQAYDYNRKNGIPSETNIQKLEGGVKLLYTKPMIISDSTIGMWSILFSRKEIVLSIDN
ncbi:hypothetical protein [Roseivirga sp.]|uniref:hypothetical protein n=1 Tax=Roseivirga sp. TaxID=1964215 RepID=UPI003B517F47